MSVTISTLPLNDCVRAVMIYYCTCVLLILLAYAIGQSLVRLSRNLSSDDRRRDISNKLAGLVPYSLAAIHSLGHDCRHNILPHFIAMQWPFTIEQKWIGTYFERDSWVEHRNLFLKDLLERLFGFATSQSIYRLRWDSVSIDRRV